MRKEWRFSLAYCRVSAFHAIFEWRMTHKTTTCLDVVIAAA